MIVLRVDLHSHSHASPDCAMGPATVIAAATKAGVGVLAVTDHDSIWGAREVAREARGSSRRLQVIVGEEVMTDRGEIIGLYLEERIDPGPLDDVVAAIRAQGGLVMLQHPFDPLRHGLGEHGERTRPDIVEVFNARTRRTKANERAAALQRRLGVPAASNSDAHTPGEYGHAWTETPEFDASDPKALLAALGAGRPVGRRSPVWVHAGSLWARLRRRRK